MVIFEFPYVIITILVFACLIMGGIGVYFTVKCVKTVNGVEEKGFSSVGKLKSTYDALKKERKNRSLVYVEISLDSMNRLYSESKAIRIMSQIRPIFLQAFSGEETSEICAYTKTDFLAVIPKKDTEAEEIMKQCLSEIQAVLLQSEAVKMAEVYFGYYAAMSTEVEFDEALSRAKQACAMAEEQKMPYCRWDSTRSKALEQKIKMENNIQSEIDNNRFFLEYQPILDAKTGKIVGAEVLSRLNSQADGVLSPGRFLSAVQSLGLNEKFDYYIFEKNCKWIASDPDKRQKYVYTINFSRSTLCDPTFSDSVIAIAESYGLNFSSLAVEILEDQSLTSDESRQMTENLAKLKEKGFLVLLDDFGRGYTSFSDLHNFDINIVKIDKDITRNATTQTGFLILKNIVQTAKELGMKTLCEGVETEEHKRLVTEAGCDMMQGYYCYRPMPVSRLEELFRNEEISL
ncbi:MAG: EAL domain-containing protein [Clostridia bacterium]|nr:EAL domain-containing protein [Clostridia bacterium]